MIFKRQNQPATHQAIAEFEHRRGVRLPEVYVEFLTSINGGYTGGIDSYVRTDGGDELIVQQILGITDNPEDSIATDRFSNFSDWLHTRMLEIAYTPNGDSLFMDLRETGTYGRIYVRAHDSPPNDSILIDDAGFDDMDDYEEALLFRPVANSFSDFIAMLGTAPDL